MAALNLERIRPLLQQLSNHPIYAAICDLDDLRVFMTHHVFLVWDFMSLIKYMQRQVAPIQVPWIPQGDPALRHFINQLVLEQESDIVPTPDGSLSYCSQFEFYCQAMNEIGADGDLPRRFLALVVGQGIEQALNSDLVPAPARDFTRATFRVIQEDRPHVVAATLAVGRENLIPGMFSEILKHIALGPERAPAFHYYLNRHIYLDDDSRGSLSMQLVTTLCGSDPLRLKEAQAAAEAALSDRIRFWDGVLEAIEQRCRA